MAAPDGGSGGGDKGKFNWSLKRHAQHKLELGFAYSGSKSYRSLIRKMKNVGLKSKQKEAEQGGSDSDSTSLPLRPHAEDCSYYMRTGSCRYGPKCKYNHPLTRPIPNVDDEDAGTEKGSDGNSEKSSVACKFYLAAGGCKNGESCNYLHSKPQSEMAILKFNFMGLPIRVGEKECPFYMRTGLCAYGSDCRFHHPDPTVVEGSDPCDSNLNAEAERYFSSTAGYICEEPFSQHFSGSSSYQAPWPSSMITNKGGPYMDNYASYMPATSLYPEGFYQTTEWSGYQVLQYSQEKKPPRSVSTGNTEMDRADLSKKVEESPESPTEPKSRVAPPRPKREPCVLNELGLPLRPGKEVCWHHANYGLCRNGRVCAFDHPMDKRSKNLPNMSKCGTKEVTPDPDDESWNSWN